GPGSCPAPAYATGTRNTSLPPSFIWPDPGSPSADHRLVQRHRSHSLVLLLERSCQAHILDNQQVLVVLSIRARREVERPEDRDAVINDHHFVVQVPRVAVE